MSANETASMKQWKKALALVEAAQEALNEALGSHDAPAEWSGNERMSRVRALQAQAQLNVLCAISYDLSDIRDAIPAQAHGGRARSPLATVSGVIIDDEGLNQERLLELAYVAEAVMEVLPAGHANVWMFSTSSTTRASQPADLIRDGKFKDVLDLIDASASGEFV